MGGNDKYGSSNHENEPFVALQLDYLLNFHLTR